MSAVETMEPSQEQEKHPENPIAEILNVIQTPEVVQVIQDDTIVADEGSARNLKAESTQTSHEAEIHTSAQIVNENQAINHVATAETASSDDTYYSNTTAAEKHSIQAESHNVLAHSATNYSEEASAKAAGLEQACKIQRTIQEENIKTSFAVEECVNRTQAAVEQEMKAMSVVEESVSDDAPAQDLEAELVATAQIASPKMA